MDRIKSVFRKDPCQKYYSLTRSLGQGSFATVKLAICKADQSKWAVKVIKKTSLTAEDEEALQSEVDILQRLDHPNIVKLKEVFDCNQNFYMVMELCTGGELFDRIVSKERYTENEARGCIKSIVAAIAYCHENNIVHRDLKPENLLYSDHDDAKSVLKLADFGLAKLLNDESLMHTACGTPGYVAPEILKGEGYGKAVDMWSIGVISYILLCGFPPFYDESNQALFKAIKAGKYDYPSPFWDEVSVGAKDLIDHLLVLDPTKRYKPAEVLAHPWMNDTSDKVLGHFKASMTAYNARRKFKATIMTVQMMNAMKRIREAEELDAQAAAEESAAEDAAAAPKGPTVTIEVATPAAVMLTKPEVGERRPSTYTEAGVDGAAAAAAAAAMAAAAAAGAAPVPSVGPAAGQ